MADNQVSDRDVQQIEELHRKLQEQPTAKAEAAVDICGLWRLIKPFWSIILTLVRLIPRVGDKIADILQKLGQGLDAFCGNG